MNFTYTLIQPPDGAYGSIQSDGSWNGMINLVHTQEADIAPGYNHKLYIGTF